MSNNGYFISSEFFELRKIAEEPEAPEEKDEVSEEDQPDDAGSTEVISEEDDEITPSEPFSEEVKSSITPQIAKIIAENDPGEFFGQSLDKMYPDLALFAMNKLFLDIDGYYDFFRLKRNGVRLYKDYPNSVESFILHKLPVNYYFKWKLNEEFPEHLDVLRKRWKGFPQYTSGLPAFFSQGIYALNPEETLSNIERIFFSENIQSTEDKSYWIKMILDLVPDSFVAQNINLFKRAFDSLIDSSDRKIQSTIKIHYFKDRLYEEMPELLDKFASKLSPYAYFSNYSVHKIEDKNVVKARVTKFIEDGNYYGIPEEFMDLEAYELIANRELNKLSEYIARLEAEGSYFTEDEDGYRIEVDLAYAVSDVGLYRVFDYIKLLNGENFSVLDESYIDKPKSNPDFSFKNIFKYIIEKLGIKLFESNNYRDLIKFLFFHKYNILYKDIIENLLSKYISKYVQENRTKGNDTERFFENSFLLYELKELIPSNHPKIFNEFFNALLERSPSTWVKNFSIEYPQFNDLIIERLKKNTIKYFSNRYGRDVVRNDFNLILDVIKASSEFYKKNYDALKNIVKDLYLNVDKIKIYFSTYREYFPELSEELIFDKETDENIAPIEALIKINPSLFFKSEKVTYGEDKKEFIRYPNRDALDLIEDYPQYSEYALYSILENEEPETRRINGIIHFVLNSEQISEEIREGVLNSDIFNNLIKFNINESTLEEYIKKYPNTFRDKIKEFLENQFETIFSSDQSENIVENISKSKFIKLFFRGNWESRSYRELFPELSRKTFAAILNSSKNNFEILGYIPDLGVYSDIFNSFIEDEDVYSLMDKAEIKSRGYGTKDSFKAQLKRKSSDEVLAPKIKEAIESDANNFLKTVFSSDYKINLVFALIKRSEPLTELFYSALLQYDLNLTFSVLLAQISRYGDLLISSKLYRRTYTVFPEFNNQINKMLSIPADQIDFAKVESKFESNPMNVLYSTIKRIGEDPAFANLDNLIKLKDHFYKYLFNNDPMIIIRNSEDGSKVGEVVRNIVEELNSINSMEIIDDEDSVKKEDLITNAKKILLYLYESYWKPNTVFPEKEKLTISLIKLIKDPLIYFQTKKNIIQRNESSGERSDYHTEIFDLKYFDEIENFKRDSLDKISNDPKLFDTFVSRRYYELISKEEYIELIKNFANKYIKQFFRILRDKTLYDHWDYFDIVKENLDLRIYLSKLLLEKEEVSDFFRFGFYKEVIENNILSLDDIIEIIYNDISKDQNTYSDIIISSHHEFFEYLKDKNSDKINDILKRFYGYRPYNLKFIKTYSEKAALDIAKDIVINVRQYLEKGENEKIIEAFNIDNIFNYPETEASLVSLLNDGIAVLNSRGFFVSDFKVNRTSKFIAKNFVFYKKHKESIPDFEIGFNFFRELNNREVAIDLLSQLQNDNFLRDSSIILPDDNKDFNIIFSEIKNIRDLKISRSIYQTEQRPSEWMSATRYTLSQINTRPTNPMYEINKKLIHAGDGAIHTNVGTSGFTSAWAKISIQTESTQNGDGKSFFVIEQYQSDYPVVLNNILKAERDDNNKLKEKYPKHYKDILAHFNIISSAYPYLVLTKAVQTAIIVGFSHIYILKNAAKLANIQNPDKAKKLYEDIPLEIASGTRVINGNLCWEIEATQEIISRLMSKAREITGKDSQYDFSLSPAQNAQLRIRDRERRKKSPWAASAEKLQKLEEINLFIKGRFPELNVPNFTNPTDAIRFLNEEVKRKVTKNQFKREFSPIVRDLAILKRSWERTIEIIKFAKLSRGKHRLRSLEIIYLEACFPRFLK